MTRTTPAGAADTGGINHGIDELEEAVAEEAVALAELVLAALVAEHAAAPAALRAAVLDGDADGAVELRRRIDEHPTRLLVAEVVLLRAQIDLERAAATAIGPEADRLAAEATQALGLYRGAITAAAAQRYGGPELSAEVGKHRALNEAAARVARTASARRREHEQRADVLEREIASKLAASRRLEAPIVRSIPHLRSS